MNWLGYTAPLLTAGATSAEQTTFNLTLLIAPIAALVGVLVAQAITLITDRRRRTAEHLKDARASAEVLLTLFQTYRDLIAPARSISKSNPAQLESGEWEKISGEASRSAAVLAGKGGHRQAVTLLIRGLSLGDRLAREGLGLTSSVHRDYYVMSDLAFETVAAWLRHEQVPRRIKRQTKRLHRDMYWYDLEWRARDQYERSGEYPKSGLVRRAWRHLIRWVRKVIRPPLLRIKVIWDALFRP